MVCDVMCDVLCDVMFCNPCDGPPQRDHACIVEFHMARNNFDCVRRFWNILGIILNITQYVIPECVEYRKVNSVLRSVEEEELG